MEKNTNTFSPLLLGLILAGGKSTRMGFDKGLIDYHGKPQYEYLFELLTQHCSEVFTSCKSEKGISTIRNPLADAFQFNSPLNGILSAFKFKKEVAWLTVPVDMPLIDEIIVRHLIAHRDISKMATCFFDSEGKNPEPLFTIWEPHAHEPLQQFCAEGKISPRDFLKVSEINIIPVPNTRFLLNINSKEEWEQYGKDWNQLS